MLIIAIPKSASTSLMKTLAKLHSLNAKQSSSFRRNPVSKYTKFIHQLHSDIRELNKIDVKELTSDEFVFKQHIFPSPNNLTHLKKIKKVVLLRKPKDVLLAYKRGINAGVHNSIPGLDSKLSSTEWLELANKVGLENDLKEFYCGWQKEKDSPNTLVVHYDDYVNRPKKVINAIEDFYDYSITRSEIKTVRARYSRYGGTTLWFLNKIRKLKSTIEPIIKNNLLGER